MPQRTGISLIVGPPNSGREGELLRRLDAARDREPVLVVPTGDEAARFERELCAAGGGAVLGVSIRTFGSLFEDMARACNLRLEPSLSPPQRLALVSAGIAATELRLLRRSSRQPGFAPALDRLLGELQAALVAPEELELAARELEDGEYERELAALYRAYVELRERAGRSDSGSRASATLAALRRAGPELEWHPTFVYGFDDLSRAQHELLAGLGAIDEVLVAVNYDDREALGAQAPMLSALRDELGAEVAVALAHNPSHTESPTLRHLDRCLFEPRAERVEPDDGLALLECAGELGEAEAIGAKIARLLAAGVAPDEIAIVLRDVATRGQVLGRILARLAIPVAVETSVGLDHTAVGRSLISLCRAAAPDGSPADLLAHLRSDPAMAPGASDWLERRIRRERPATVADAVAGWEKPPRHLAAVRDAGDPAERMQSLARVARELAEAPHREAAPLAGSEGAGPVPFEPLELRAAGVAAELLGELAEIGELPGCESPDLAEAAEALEGARVPLWRGPAEGRVRILDPYRVRAGRAGYLFCAGLGEGSFPRRAPADPLLSDERRAALGIAALRRRDPESEERYLFHACVSRPSERLYLSWQACDDDGAPAARSPFVDSVLELLAPDPALAEQRLVRRRGLERVVFDRGEAPTERELARAQALAAEPVAPAQPGPLREPAVLAALARKRVVSATSLEGWLECSYRWFVSHELSPQGLDPTPDPLRLGSVAHGALERLYRDPPGTDSIPRPGDVGRWKARLAELFALVATEQGMRPNEPPDSVALARLRLQVERFLDDETELETALRPRPDLLEAEFGFDDDTGLKLGEATLRGQIDRVDVAPDGAAVVRDYKTSREMPGLKTWEDKGKLQLQLYVLAARECLELDPVAGFYVPLGGRGKQRRPRGIVNRSAPAVAELPTVGGDSCDADAFKDELDRARELATEKAGAMRGGEIDRDPLGGRCPDYCTFQAICRLERAVGLEAESENGNGGTG